MTIPDPTLAARLADPNAIHINMLNGRIAKPSVTQIVHIYAGQLITTAEADARVEAAVLAEREACAEILDAKAADHDADAARFRGGSDPHHNRSFLAKTAREHAAAIRSRGVTG